MNFNNKPVSTLSYWPGKDFEIVGVIKSTGTINPARGYIFTTNLSKTIHLEDETPLANSIALKHDNIPLKELEAEWEKIDAIIDYKIQTINDKEVITGTAIKFK